MNQELFSDSKWAILSEIADKPQSASELSKKFDTTISNMTQQLKILEYTGILSKRKQKHKGPGKAKSIYSLSGCKTFMISLGKNGARKQEVKTAREELMSNIWLYAPEESKYFIEKFFWENEKLMESKGIFLKPGGQKISLEIIGEKCRLKTNIKNGKTHKEFRVEFVEAPSEKSIALVADNE